MECRLIPILDFHEQLPSFAQLAWEARELTAPEYADIIPPAERNRYRTAARRLRRAALAEPMRHWSARRFMIEIGILWYGAWLAAAATAAFVLRPRSVDTDDGASTVLLLMAELAALGVGALWGVHRWAALQQDFVWADEYRVQRIEREMRLRSSGGFNGWRLVESTDGIIILTPMDEPTTPPDPAPPMPNEASRPGKFLGGGRNALRPCPIPLRFSIPYPPFPYSLHRHFRLRALHPLSGGGEPVADRPTPMAQRHRYRNRRPPIRSLCRALVAHGTQGGRPSPGRGTADHSGRVGPDPGADGRLLSGREPNPLVGAGTRSCLARLAPPLFATLSSGWMGPPPIGIVTRYDPTAMSRQMGSQTRCDPHHHCDMPKSHRPETRLARLTTICERLPEVSVQRKGRHAQFSVRGRTFVYFLDDHHGDGIVSFCWKTERGENAKWAALDPERFYLPAYIGSRGWAALRLDRGRVNWKEVEDFVRDSYRLIAPKSLQG